MMTFRFLNKQELREYVEAPSFAGMADIPITEHRALAHWMNPKATINHPLLLLAEEEGQLLGYLGVLPEWVFGQSEEPIPCGWLTCMWVSAKARGRGLAGELLIRMNEAYDGRVLLADYVPATIRVYEKTNAFTGPLSVAGLRGYLRLDLKTIVPARYPKRKNLKSLLGVTDKLFNLIFDRRFLFRKKKKSNFSIVDAITPEIESFIAPFYKSQSFERNGQDIQWMMDYPWVLNGDANDVLNTKYQFSAIDTFFKNYATVVYSQSNQIIGFLLLTKRNSHLKVPHAFFSEDHVGEVAKALEQLMLDLKINTFTVFHPFLVAHFRLNGGVFIYKKSLYRNYLFSTGFASTIDVDKLSFQDGDGDVGFT